MKKLGKQRTRVVKRRAQKIYEKLPEAFTTEFQNNKEKLKGLDLPLTKVNRNIIAGYLTDLAEEKVL